MPPKKTKSSKTPAASPPLREYTDGRAQFTPGTATKRVNLTVTEAEFNALRAKGDAKGIRQVASYVYSLVAADLKS